MYQSIAENLTTFVRLYDEHFLSQWGPITHRQEKTFCKFLECGIYSFGFARARCPDCKFEFLVAYSCQLKGVCPSCAAKRYEIFSRFVMDEVIADVTHRQLVFTLPKMIRSHFFTLKARSALCRMMKEALIVFFRLALGFKAKDAMQSGVVCVLQTFGDQLNFNPHLHCLVAQGVFSQGYFISCPFQPSDFVRLEKIFQAKVLGYLVKKDCLDWDLSEKMLQWKYTGFSVNGDVLILPGDQDLLLRVLRYFGRPPVSFARVKYDKNKGEVTLFKHKRNKGQQEISTTLHVMEFMARLTKQIPPKGSHNQRYYGFYSSKSRGQRRKLEIREEPLRIQQKPRPKKTSKSWAMLIQQVWQVDPLVCPKCNGQMKLISFIDRGQSQVIEKILSSVNIPMPDLEEMARGPPRWRQIQQAQEHMDQYPESYPQEEDLDQSVGLDEEAYFKDPP